MARIPAGTVECRDPALCHGARFHYPTTAAACGATTSTIRQAHIIKSLPPQQQADPSCPVHGIEPEGEYEVAALNKQQVVGGVMGGLAILGLCSCSPDPANTASPGPTTTIEQTATPNPTDTSAPFIISDAEWPAEQPGYVFSDQPQGAAEQYIYDNYPELWAVGVRSLTGKYVAGYEWGDPSTPGATVQYINGNRYEGTDSLPLGFRGQYDDPDSLPTDDFTANKESLKDPSRTQLDGNTGQGGYVVSILEDRDGNGATLTVTQLGKSSADTSTVLTQKFADWEDGFASLKKAKFSIDIPGERTLYPGEIANISLARQYTDSKHHQSLEFGVYNPKTGKIEWLGKD